MPFVINFDQFPAGYSLNAAKKGEAVSVTLREFTSSEDGSLFISRLEGIPSDILSRLPVHYPPSTIDHLLALVEKNGRTTVYVNELSIIAKTRIKNNKKAGDPIIGDEIADIISVKFSDLEIPKDVGVALIISVGWRKGFFFDLSPLHFDNPQREYDIDAQFGRILAYLTFQENFQITDFDFQEFFKQQWFPFISLSIDVRRALIAHIKQGWCVDENLIEKIKTNVTSMIPSMRCRWADHKFFQPHYELLSHALSKFSEMDYISATSIIFPRIEGVIRSAHLQLVVNKGITQNSMAEIVLSPSFSTLR